MIQPRLATLIDTRSFGTLDAVLLPFEDEPTLHLSHHAEHGEDHVPHLATGGDVRVKHRDERALLLTLVDEVEHVARVAPQPVKASDDQFIAGAKESDNSFKLDPTFTAAARHLL